MTFILSDMLAWTQAPPFYKHAISSNLRDWKSHQDDVQLLRPLPGKVATNTVFGPPWGHPNSATFLPYDHPTTSAGRCLVCHIRNLQFPSNCEQLGQSSEYKNHINIRQVENGSTQHQRGHIFFLS